MARKERIDLEIHLRQLQLLPMEKKAESRHLFNISLIWPRVLIPQRSTLRPLLLKHGAWGKEETPTWCQSILFKETTEGSFGIQCSLSAPVQNSAWQKAARAVTAGAVHIGADLLEDAIPGPGGRFAALPVDYLAGQIKNTPETPILGIAAQDLSASLFDQQNSLLLTLPLLAEHNITHMVPKGPPRDRHYTRQTLYPKDNTIGSVILELKVL